MSVKTSEDKYIQKDRMRYIKNSACSNLCYLGLLADVFYFVLLYRQDVNTYYYKIQIGASVIYNLIFMLAVFLASEGVKNYKKNYSIVLLVAGIMQIVRIFVIPMAALKAPATVNGVETTVMSGKTFTLCLVYLGISAAALLFSAVLNVIRCSALEAHLKDLEQTKA